jgi:hypothetical protein
MFAGHQAAFAKDHCALDRVSQLTHVARPRMTK